MAIRAAEFNPIRRQPNRRRQQITEAGFDPARAKALMQQRQGQQPIQAAQPVQPSGLGQPAPAQPVAQPGLGQQTQQLQAGLGQSAQSGQSGLRQQLQQLGQGQQPVPGAQPQAGVGSTGITGLPAGPNVTAFTAEDNLRNKQIAPGGDPSRSAMAQQTFDLIREQGDRGFDADIRKVGQGAAKFGRIGAGMTTSELGDVTTRRNEFLGRAQRDLALRAAGDEFGDRRSNRGELREERGFQDRLAQRSIENARNQTLDEDFLKGSEFGRQGQVNDFLLRAGQGGNANELLASDALLPQGTSTFDFMQEAALRRGRGEEEDPTLRRRIPRIARRPIQPAGTPARF